MSLKGAFVSKCSTPGCGHELTFDSDSFDFDNTWTDEDRGMGDEVGFEAEVEQECSNCKANYQAKYTYTEYPIGALNYESFEFSDPTAEVIKNTLSLI